MNWNNSCCSNHTVSTVPFQVVKLEGDAEGNCNQPNLTSVRLERAALQVLGWLVPQMVFAAGIIYSLLNMPFLQSLCVRIHVHTPHHHVQPFPKRFKQVWEAVSHSFYSYMCCMVTGILYGSALVTLDPSWNNLCFLFFFPLTHDKHLQTSPDYDDNLTCEGVKKITKQQKSPVSSQTFLPLPLLRLPNPLFFFVFFFLLMCFCSL